MLSRIQHTVVNAINKSKKLLKFVVMVLDDDLLTYLNYYRNGLISLLGPWIEWLMQDITTFFTERKQKLPENTQRPNEPFIYWTIAPTHSGFVIKKNDLRQKLNLCLQMTCRQFEMIRVVKFKDIWQYDDTSSVEANKITEEGMSKYWRALDATVRFNIAKREVYLAKCKFQELQASESIPIQSNSIAMLHGHISKQDRQGSDERDPIRRFFKKKSDRYHWNRRDSREDMSNRFLLPRLKQRY